MNKIKKSFKQTFLWIKELLPILIWVLLLVSLINNSVFFINILTSLEDNFISVFIADIIASISAWNAINSYIIANWIWELENNTKIITTFLIAWVTVWIIQIPAEIYFFWKRFTLIRNLISFIFAIIGWYVVYFLMKI
jgi:uncharacterized membrane protein